MDIFHSLFLTKVQASIDEKKLAMAKAFAEVLSKSARLKKAALMKRLAPKMAKKRAIKAKRAKTGKELKVI